MENDLSMIAEIVAKMKDDTFVIADNVNDIWIGMVEAEKEDEDEQKVENGTNS